MATATMVHDDTPSSRNSLWMGDLEPWMDEAYLRQLWFSLGCNVRFWRLDTPKNFVLGSNTSFLFFFFSFPFFLLRLQVAVKLVRSKTTGQPAGYCFLDFSSQQAAQVTKEDSVARK